MSSLSTLDQEDIAELVSYPRGPGYVLHFSDRDFAAFFRQQFRIDIDADRFKDLGTSKGKRLRSFLNQATNPTALRALTALWEHRVALLRRQDGDDPATNAEARYLAMVNRLGGGPAAEKEPEEPAEPKLDGNQVAELKADLLRVSQLDPHTRGYEFERFLTGLFEAHGLRPREPFRNRGEQIDGSFVLGAATYLLEAKWQAQLTGVADLRAFEGKLQDKASWARGFFISQTGFSDDGLAAFGRGKRTVCMDGLDLYDMLDRSLPFDHVIDRKVRAAAETGWPFRRVRDLF